MATQGKGILGNPNGIIGVTNNYQRLGKSVMQSRSKSKDPYLTRWPLIEYKLRQRLEVYWQRMNNGQRNEWNAIAVPGQTKKEAFFAEALATAETNKSTTMAITRFSQLSSWPRLFFTGIGNWESAELSMTVPEDSIIHAESTRMIWRMRYYLKLGGTIKLEQTFFLNTGPVFNHKMDIANLALSNFVTVEIDGQANKKNYSEYIVGLMNPDELP